MGLEALEGMAAQVDMELTPENFEPAAPEVAEPAGPDYGAEAGACVDIFAGLVCGVAPKAEAIWTPEAKDRTRQALAPVLEKWGVTLGGLPPELTLAIVAGPLLWQSARAVAETMDQKQAERKRQVQGGQVEQRPAPGPAVPDGPAVHEQMALYAAKN